MRWCGEAARTQDVRGAEGISGRVKFLPLVWAGMPKTSFRKNSDSPILTSRGLGTVLGNLAQLGFNAQWGCLSAAAIGANHKRERIWIVGYSSSNRDGRITSNMTGQSLSQMVNSTEYWPTPLSRDYRYGINKETLERRKKQSSRGVNLSEELQRRTGTSGKLNPMWVEWLMGWPLGWTELKPLEMDKSLNAQHKHGNY